MARSSFDLLLARGRATARNARMTAFAQLIGRSGLARQQAQRLYLDIQQPVTVGIVPVVPDAPVVGLPVVQQDHALAIVDSATGAPVVGLVAVQQGHAVAPVGVAAGALVAGVPAFGQMHSLGVLGAVSGVPVIGLPDLVIVRMVAGLPVVLGAPVVGIVQVLPGGRAARRVSADVLGRAPEDARPLAVGGQRAEVSGSVRSPVPAPVMRRPAGMQARRGYSGGRR